MKVHVSYDDFSLAVFLACLFFFCFPSCSLDRPMSKRCSGLSTCTLWKLSQDLHKLNSYPRTDVGVGTPGKKRSALAAVDNEHYANYGEQFDINN